ncbi:golgi-body localization protein domain-containing protein [Mycena galericulata]|nr:golgi-body localization protein domain-containing protein [Mycena galericulata]
MANLFDGLLYILRVLLLTSPGDVWWTSFSVWLVRLIAFSLLLRTYIVPWAVGRLSRHLRVRSISLRSVRGLYARAGAQTLRADRISWTWSYVDGSRRMTIQVDGLTLEIGTPPQRSLDRHSRALTFADLAPSPMAHRLWMLFSGLYSLMDPFLRPLVRTYFSACLRLLISWALDLHSPTITFADIPGAKIVANTMTIRTVLAFTQTEKPQQAALSLKPLSRHRTSYSVAAWRRRLTHSVQRSWDRAWGQTHGSATVELKFQNIMGSLDSVVDSSGDFSPQGESVNFFTLPGSIDFKASLGFSPKRGSVDPHSVNVSLILSDANTASSPHFGDSHSPLLSPVTPGPSFLLTPASPTSPRSPFLSAFSSSLAFLASASFHMSKITATAAQKAAQYTVIVHRVAVNASMNSNGGVFNVSTGQIKVDRTTRPFSRIRLLMIKSTDFQSLAIQWPINWLHSSPFIGGDPNAPFFAVQARLGAIDLTERLDSLTGLLADLPRSETKPSEPPLTMPSYYFPVPRVSFEIECGAICARLIVGTKPVEAPTLELRTDGFIVSVISRFLPRPTPRSRSAATPPRTEFLLLQLNAKVAVVLRPIFLRVCTTRSGHAPAVIDDPVLLSMEALELTGHVEADSSINEDGNIAVVDWPSKVLHLHCTTDALCVELWHPLVIDALTQMLSSLPAKVENPQSQPTSSIVEKMPRGVSLTMSLVRCVVFVTAPDINPDDTMDLCRGFAVRATGLSLQQKLYLSQETLLPAVLTASRTNSTAIVVGIALPDLAFRSAVSTQYDADDPLIAERDDPSLKDAGVFAFKKLSCNGVAFQRDCFGQLLPSPTAASCPWPYQYIYGTLQLAHMYSILLGTATLKQLAQARPSRPAGHIPTASDPGTIRTVQVFCTLPTQRVKPLVAKWDRALVWVKVPPALRMCQPESSEDRWEVFISLHKWSVTFPSGIRIPYGFVLANLLLDTSVVVKAVRHLARICVLGQYYAMSTPEAEGPKSVPKLIGLDAAKNRKDREEAFAAKVQSILTAETFSRNADGPDYKFDPNHSISIEEARDRLNEVHSVDWSMRLNVAKNRQVKDEEAIMRKHLGAHHFKPVSSIPNLVQVSPTPSTPPLLRLLLTNITLNIGPPSFPLSKLPDFMFERGNGLPVDTEFSLLVPMHINFGLSSLRVTLRDYPLPLVDIPPQTDKTLFGFDFDSDLVVAEEMGTHLSVDWVDCPVVSSDYGLPGAALFSLSVPKTIMAVKSYASPVIAVTAADATTFSWGVSYGPATQDLMRVVETLSSAPRDWSPGMGFWDKMRLIFHWSVRADFAGEVRFQMKGLRDPYTINGAGAGFVFAWQGHPKLLVAQQNDDRELIQVLSESMFLPAYAQVQEKPRQHADTGRPRPFQKICAKFGSGVCFGIGFVMERSCGPECSACSGTAYQRKCRLYNFFPHYEVKLEKKSRIPLRKSAEDSFNGFRSDFIHLSTSLTSALNVKTGMELESSSLHLTPQAFTHFWSWWALFNGVLTLPIRQGTAWPIRPISPKFGRHLATIKYRISVKNLYIMHAYIDDSRETWADGVTPWIGVKGLIEEFQVDMHQREEETTVPGIRPDTTKTARRKPFCAVELVMKGLDLRAMLATFSDPLKIDVGVGVDSTPQRSNYRTLSDLPPLPVGSTWIDGDDFIELDWTPPSTPSLHLLPVATCPRFTYYRRSETTRQQEDCSKFGLEITHTCYLKKEPSVLRVQIDLAMARVLDENADVQTMEKMLLLLEDYITLIEETEAGSRPKGETNDHSYHIPSDTLSEAEWDEFDNVYQIHCPKIFLDAAIRDIMMQYYYCSRSRRGIEYHMATRAVKFIRDQAEDVSVMAGRDKHRSLGTAQAAAHALRKILSGHERKSLDQEHVQEPPIDTNPLEGWFEGVSLLKGHCCLLLKPQIVLRAESGSDQTCVVAAVQAKLQSYAIMDNSNVDDPISGKVMSRTFATLSGLQTFSPASADYSGDGCVPLEVLIDFRCESNDFERLVPQTDATFHYDKFNRLRLRNNVTSVVRSMPEKAGLGNHNHLHDQTDLIQVNIPQFTVTANDQHFQIISNIVAKLLLFSDAAHKTRVNKLETLLFTYDFNDLASVANVVTDLQTSLRDAIETELMADISHLTVETAKLEMLKLKAHKMLLSEELSGLFDCIKLAQDQRENQSEPKSALLLHTSSSEISWRMLDDQREMLAKLVVQNIDFFWLSRQDSSTVNNLTVGNLQAFDGSRDARWAEILSKYDEPANHALLKKGLFVLANWSVLAPVGGITIYESFELNFHPMRLQVDAKVGRRIMEYVWPARRNRKRLTEDDTYFSMENIAEGNPMSRASLDSPRTEAKQASLSAPTLAPVKLSASRSFTDLRSASQSLAPPSAPHLHRTRSSDGLRQASLPATPSVEQPRKKARSDSSNKIAQLAKKTGDAAEMKTRSSQKSFVLVRISSLNLLLSIMKEESFVCRDAHIRTRDLEYRNQTWSFEELVDQFIPSDMSWKGWLKMAFQQPLVPVLPVARELISKTKWIANKSTAQDINAKGLTQEDDGAESDKSHSHPRWRRRKRPDASPVVPGAVLTTEPEDEGSRPPSRNRVFTLFQRPIKMTPSNSGSTTTSGDSRKL